MYRAQYREIGEDTGQAARDNESLAFGRAIELLKLAEAKGAGTREAIDALFYLNRLWGVLLEDLVHPDNGLPAKLRADLISIGIWVLRRAEDIRGGQSEDFGGLIDICEAIRGGLGKT